MGCTTPRPPARDAAATSSGLLQGYMGPQIRGVSTRAWARKRRTASFWSLEGMVFGTVIGNCPSDGTWPWGRSSLPITREVPMKPANPAFIFLTALAVTSSLVAPARAEEKKSSKHSDSSWSESFSEWVQDMSEGWADTFSGPKRTAAPFKWTG